MTTHFAEFDGYVSVPVDDVAYVQTFGADEDDGYTPHVMLVLRDGTEFVSRDFESADEAQMARADFVMRAEMAAGESAS